MRVSSAFAQRSWGACPRPVDTTRSAAAEGVPEPQGEPLVRRAQTVRSQRSRQRPPGRRAALLAYTLFLVLIGGVAVIRHLEGNRHPKPATPVAEALEAHILAVLERFGVGASAIHTQVSATEDGVRLLSAALPDTVSLTRVDLAIAQAARGLSVTIEDCQLSKLGRLLEMRLEHGGRPILDLQLRRLSPPEKSSAADELKGPDLPQVAIIIDDLGHNESPLVLDLLDLSPGLTFGVLPGRPHARNLALRCYRMGREVIMHQPMEALAGQDPGPGAICTGMPDDQIAAIVRDNLRQVPCAVGVNNHMGSKATGDSITVGALMQAVAKEGALFFVDSRTTPSSVIMRAARRWQVPCGASSIFLDSQDDAEAISDNLGRLAKIAEARGRAIGIGHPRIRTYEALAHTLAQNEGRVWNLVPASVVVGGEQT